MLKESGKKLRLLQKLKPKPKHKHSASEKKQKKLLVLLQKLLPRLRRSAWSMRKLRDLGRKLRPMLRKSVARLMKPRLWPSNVPKRLPKQRLQPEVSPLPKHLRI